LVILLKILSVPTDMNLKLQGRLMSNSSESLIGADWLTVSIKAADCCCHGLLLHVHHCPPVNEAYSRDGHIALDKGSVCGNLFLHDSIKTGICITFGKFEVHIEGHLYNKHRR
jgi:hypothetical protein